MVFDNDDLLLLILAEEQQQREEPSLQDQARRKRTGQIRRVSLRMPNRSPFRYLFNSFKDDALITLCGFNHKTFNDLLVLFTPYYDNYTPYTDNFTGVFHLKRTAYTRNNKKKGRPRLMNATDALALYLAWTRTRGSHKTLQLIFGLTSCPLSMHLRFARRIIVKILLRHPDAHVKMPTTTEVGLFASAINEKYPSLRDVWGAMDGLKLYIERSGNEREQNMFFNGWTHDHYVTSLFLFSPDGRIRASFLNCPGAWHDSTLALMSGIYDKIDEVYARDRMRVVVDSAFSKESRDSLLKSHQNNIDRMGRVRTTARQFADATSVRQLSEWGMAGLQRSFPRLKERLAYEEQGERKLILTSIVLLYNFRASTVGYNQIKSTYMQQSLGRDANEIFN
jgi:DDE superfamily endonuclease